MGVRYRNTRMQVVDDMVLHTRAYVAQTDRKLRVFW